MLGLKLIGVPRLLVDGSDATASIQYRKGWALLAYLAVERSRRHSREHLAQLLWPALAPAAARTNLRQVIANLNRVLERHGAAGWLDPARDALWLQTDANVDVLWLERAGAKGVDADGVEAAERWAAGLDGELLEGLAFPDCSEFDDWLQDERRRIATASAQALEALLQAQHAAGHVRRAVETAQRLAALDPWDERRLRQLMSLLAEDGRLDQALAAYARLRESLQADVGSEPEAATRELHEAIATRASQPRARPASASAADGERRWIGAVYCQWRGAASPNDMHELGARAEQAGARIVAASAQGLLACFVDTSGTDGLRATEARAARAAIELRGAFAARAAFALCSGLARVEASGSMQPLALIGNPVEWVFDLCARAQPGQVLACDSMADGLRGAFDLRPAGQADVPGVDVPTALWELGDSLGPGSAAAPARGEPGRGAREECDTDRLRLRPDLHTEPRRPQAANDAAPAGTAMAWLTVVQGEDQGKRVGLGAKPMVVGRASDSDLQIVHRTVSRHHCVVWVEGRDIRLRDLGATNRTRVNGASVQDVRLQHGDEIALGDSLLRFERQPDAPTVPVRRAG